MPRARPPSKHCQGAHEPVAFDAHTELTADGRQGDGVGWSSAG